MRLLDLFCGAGGAAEGYRRAGFTEIVGVDHKPQPRYPFEFVQADALTFPLDGFDVIHASPPCQAFSNARVIHGVEHPDLLSPTRERLVANSMPWVIENVPNAPMRVDVRLCGSMFGLRSPAGRLIRHRWFEFSSPPAALTLLPSCDHSLPVVSVFGHGGHIYRGVEDWRTVMGIPWMTRAELAQAIPPAYADPNETIFYELDMSTLPGSPTSIAISMVTSSGDADMYLAAPGTTPGIPGMIFHSIHGAPMDEILIDATGLVSPPGGQQSITSEWVLSDYLNAGTNLSFAVHSWDFTSDYTVTITCN